MYTDRGYGASPSVQSGPRVLRLLRGHRGMKCYVYTLCARLSNASISRPVNPLQNAAQLRHCVAHLNAVKWPPGGGGGF